MFATPQFPRRGAFARYGDLIVIVVAQGFEESKLVDVEIDGKMEKVRRTFVEKEAPAWEVHVVDSNPKSKTFGEHKETIKNVPTEELTQCAWDDISALVLHRNKGDTTYAMLQAHFQGYTLTEAQLREVPGLIAAAKQLEEQRVRLAQHPEVVALEAELSKELEQLSAAHEARRQAIVARLTPSHKE